MKTVDDILEAQGCALWTTTPDASVEEATLLMAEKNIGALPVVENGRLVGIISERDYTRKILLPGRNPQFTRVREVMTPDVIHAHPSQTVRECMRVMILGQFRHLPVLLGDELIGMISIHDLAKALTTGPLG